MEKVKLSKMISEEQIQKRIEEIGKKLSGQFKDKELTAICVLRGAFMYYADLIRHIDSDLRCEFFGVSSYSKMQSSGEVKLTMDLTSPIEGRHVLLVEDIVDTGLTMNYLIRTLEARKPKSLTTTALLFKPAALKVECKLDHVGFEIENDFVVGYGLDFDGRYRNLPYIARVSNVQ